MHTDTIGNLADEVIGFGGAELLGYLQSLPKDQRDQGAYMAAVNRGGQTIRLRPLTRNLTIKPAPDEVALKHAKEYAMFGRSHPGTVRSELLVIGVYGLDPDANEYIAVAAMYRAGLIDEEEVLNIADILRNPLIARLFQKGSPS